MAPSPSFLIGPPEIYRGAPLTTTARTQKPQTKAPVWYPQMEIPTLTPCQFLFFKITPSTPPETLFRWLERAWKEDPNTTLKLICYLGLATIKGKPNKHAFFNSVLWLHKYQHYVLASNLAVLASFGYLKDLPEILYRILVFEMENGGYSQSSMLNQGENVKMVRIENEEMEKEETRVLRRETDMFWAECAVFFHRTVSAYHFLHNCVADIYADLLKSDIEFLNLGEVEKISLAAKWCPSVNSFYDRRTLICESVAKAVFPFDSDPGYFDIENAHYVYRVRNRLMKEVLVPLRKALVSRTRCDPITHRPIRPIVSTTVKKMYSGLWTADYNKRFNVYVEIAARTMKKKKLLLPHEIVALLRDESSSMVAESKWERLVNYLKRKGSLKNCLAVFGISRDMNKMQKDICVSMGLLVSELSEEPWKGRIVSFGEDPKIRMIQGSNLRAKNEFMRQLDYSKAENIKRVFDQIFEFALAEKISQENMPQKIFVFTDMGLQQVSACLWGMWGSYRRRRGCTTLPEIVFWNLRGETGILNFPARNLNRVTMVDGFSNDSLAALLERDVVPTLEDLMRSIGPDNILKSTISGDLYDNLLV
ncbi:PREDICTED: uncharacterized protein LOC105111340 [Populus euphratica]|uniref:Uncharacterized protein LOC105111340 n=1 Tax=Populus euphratica TaxID=75702 RepID=A0AAJ6T632_POPEU|nr:PREDICTED: uncharacterized protein LOC105111340 [Populus euphratica]